MNRGRLKYVPSDVLKELKSIMVGDGIHKEAEAFRRMVDYSKKSRGVVDEASFYPLGLRKRKKGGGLF